MDQRLTLATGVVEKIGEASSRIKHIIPALTRELRPSRRQGVTKELVVADHHQGLALMADLLMDESVGVIQSPSEIAAIGHRVVHGGERFSQPTVITAEVRQETIKKLIPLAPLHNPANLTGIEVAIEIFPQATQVAVFDTAFHQTMPPQAYRYAIPNQLYEEHSIRSYGFHGTSHLYVTNQAIAYLGKAAADTNLITAHLGNGCSITAVRGGQSVDSSMGFSPLAGLIMGTRSGDIDPAIPFFLGTSLGMSFRRNRQAAQQAERAAGPHRPKRPARYRRTAGARGRRSAVGLGNVRLPHQEIHRRLHGRPRPCRCPRLHRRCGRKKRCRARPNLRRPRITWASPSMRKRI